MLSLQTETQQAHAAVQRRVMAAMETGNVDAARTALIEYEAVSPEAGRALRSSVIRAYGTSL